MDGSGIKLWQERAPGSSLTSSPRASPGLWSARSRAPNRGKIGAGCCHHSSLSGLGCSQQELHSWDSHLWAGSAAGTAPNPPAGQGWDGKATEIGKDQLILGGMGGLGTPQTCRDLLTQLGDTPNFGTVPSQWREAKINSIKIITVWIDCHLCNSSCSEIEG